MEKIDCALSLLEEAHSGVTHPPAIVVMPPDSGAFIVGNQGGFLSLAMASIKAAKGEQQKFNKQSWATELELDWAVAGLKPDENAHSYLPKKRRFWSKILGYVFMGAVIAVFVTGCVMVFQWLKGLL